MQKTQQRTSPPLRRSKTSKGGNIITSPAGATKAACTPVVSAPRAAYLNVARSPCDSPVVLPGSRVLSKFQDSPSIRATPTNSPKTLTPRIMNQDWATKKKEEPDPKEAPPPPGRENLTRQDSFPKIENETLSLKRKSSNPPDQTMRREKDYEKEYIKLMQEFAKLTVENKKQATTLQTLREAYDPSQSNRDLVHVIGDHIKDLRAKLVDENKEFKVKYAKMAKNYDKLLKALEKNSSAGDPSAHSPASPTSIQIYEQQQGGSTVVKKSLRAPLSQRARTGESLDVETWTEKKFRNFLEKNRLIRFLELFYPRIAENTVSNSETQFFEVDEAKTNSISLVHAPKNILVHYLTLPENSPIRAFWNYDRFLYHFLIIFPSFLSPLELLSELIQRWDALPGPQEDVDGHGMSVRYSIAGVLREWLQMPWSNDFKEEPLRETLEAFLEANTKGEFNRVIEQLQLLHSTAGEGKSTFGAPPPPVALEKKPSSIYETSPLETARQLTLIASELYSRLDRDQFLKGAWYGEMKAERAGGLLGIIEHSNEVTCWVTTEILKFCSAESRAEMISFWIQTLSHLLQLNNYNTMIQILSSLHSSVISKLKHSWKLISKKDKDLLDTITQLMSTQSHYKAYREAITNLNENTPCIPLIHVICSDLFTIHDTLTDCSVVENEWVNWRKFDVMASRISELVRFNRVNYNLEVEMRVKGMVLNSERWLNHDVNYEIACVLEDTVNLEEELEVQNYTNTWDLYQMPFLSERDKKLIVTGAKSIAFQADQVILGENEKNCYLYLIEKGKVKVKSSGVIISRLKDGDFFGEISLFSKKPTTASVISETNCQIYQIEVDLVEDLCIHKPNVAVQLIRTLINKLITYTKEICEIEFIPHTQSQPSIRMSEESPHLNLSLPTLNNFPLNSIDTSSETTDTQEQSLNFGKRLKSARRSRKLTFATNEKYYEHKAKRHSLKAKSSEFVLLNQIEAQNPLDSSDNSSNTKKSKFPDLSVSQQTRKRSSSHSIRNHLKKSKSESSQKIVKVNKKKKSGNLTPRLAFSKEEPEGGSLQESNEPTESLSKKSKRESEYKFGKLIVSSRVKGKDSEPILPPNQDTGIDEKISKHFHGEKELLDEVVVREFSCSLLKHPSKVKSTGQLLITQHFVLFVGSAGKVGFGKIRFYYSFKDIAAITFNPTPQTLAVTISKPDEATVVFGSFCSTPAEVYRFVAELWKRHTDGAVDLDEQAPISPGTDWDLKAEMDWKKIFKGGKVCKFEKNECIVREGDMTHKIYHLVQGKCRVEKGNGEIVQYIYPGKMGLFGEMSFIEGKPSPFSVIAEEKSLVHLCEGYYLNILFQRYPAIASRFYNYLAVVLAKRRVLDLKGEPLVLHSERPLMRRKAQSRLLMKKKQGAWLYYLEHSGVTDVVLSDTESEEWVEEENAAEESESLEENVQLQ